ncbi:MAG: hypothetical protein ACLQVD_06165 [Capsulimonadaceae bacterium]
MAYSVEALLSRDDCLLTVPHLFPSAVVVEVRQGLRLVPLTAAVHEEIQAWLDEPVPGILLDYGEKIPGHILVAAATISDQCTVAYLRAQFYGGAGGHTMCVWHEGGVVLGPLVAQSSLSTLSDNAANTMLRYLGIERDGCLDEFEGAGLARFRRTDDWAAGKRLE